MVEVITDPQMRGFVHSMVSKEFNLTVDQVAEKCKNDGRFAAWLNSDLVRIKEVLNKVKANGVSPAFFAAYEKTEGYNSKWGWLNHTSVNGDPVTDADSVSKWVATQSTNTTDAPAWIDFANYKDFVPESVKIAGNADFAGMTVGSIGKVVIAGTAAATWEVYYPNGLLAEYNGVQDYGKPITKMLETIVTAWGGSLDGGTDPVPDPDPDPEPEPEPDDTPGGIDLAGFVKSLNELISKMLTADVYKSGSSQQYKNNHLILLKQMENMYKIKPNKKFFEAIAEKFNEFNESYIPEPEEPEEPDPTDPEPDPDPEPSNTKRFPVKIQNGINFFKRANWGVGTLQRNMTYGTRSSGIDHCGYDIGGGGRSHTIYAVRGGEVLTANFGNGIGYRVIIKNDDDVYFMQYGHLDSFLVKVGDKVAAGDPIGNMGATGGNYAIHLDIKISPSPTGFNSLTTTIDPEPYLEIDRDGSTKLQQP